MYKKIGREFAGHGATLHGARQYDDYMDCTIHTNTVEGAFSIFKRGVKGIYQHCGERHLHRYLAEFEFRYNTRQANGIDDRGRAFAAVRGRETDDDTEHFDKCLGNLVKHKPPERKS